MSDEPNKNGVETKKEVSASQIKGVRVRFIPEVTRNFNKQVTTRSMVDSNIVWEEWGKKKAASTGNSGSTADDSGSGSTGGDGNSSENPLG